MNDLSRRTFVKGAALGVAAMAAAPATRGNASERIRVAVIGIRGRGGDHLEGLLAQPNLEVATLCDVDSRLFDPVSKKFFGEKGLPIPKFESDMRKVFEDDSIDAVTIATPNHWHSLAAIWAMQAGKDVYCEKPCSHNLFEGRQLVNAAKKYKRICQHGTQIRSSPAIQEAVKKLGEGVIGEVYMARGLCYRWRPTIGHFDVSEPPKEVDYNTWLGPAPEKPFTENRFHYNWHYMWDYGNGDIGNQGVHQMDIARWGLGVGLPTRITSSSGMFIYKDDKEVPNVINTSFEFPSDGPQGKMLVFDTRPYYTNDEDGARVGVIFYGSEGYMVIDDYDHYKTYLGTPQNDKKFEPGPELRQDGDHYANFLDAVRKQDASILNAPIEEGHLSSALCHLGLTSARLGRSLSFDPATERYVGDDEANETLTRPYREPFVVPEIV